MRLCWRGERRSTSPVAAMARKWFSVSQADRAWALSCSTSLFMLRPRLCASDLSRCAVSSGSRMVKVLISIPPDIARVSVPADFPSATRHHADQIPQIVGDDGLRPASQRQLNQMVVTLVVQIGPPTVVHRHPSPLSRASATSTFCRSSAVVASPHSPWVRSPDHAG